MTEGAPGAPPEQNAEMLLGIDLRERAERLITAAEAFAGSNVSLRRVAARVGIMLSAFIVLLLTAVLVFCIAVFADLHAGHDVRNQLLDCVQPTGKCYQQGQARTAEILDQVNNQGIIRAACAQEEIAVEPITARIVAIAACIARESK